METFPLKICPESTWNTCLHNRRMIPRDSDVVAVWMTEEIPVPPALAASLANTLRALLRDGRVSGVCVEEIEPCRDGETVNRRLVAFGMSAFLSDECAEEQLATPAPHLVLKLMDRARRGQTPIGLLDWNETGAANAGEGLNLFPFLWLQRPADPSSPEGARLLTRATRFLLDEHRGYNLKRILKEAAPEQQNACVRNGLKRLRSIPHAAQSPSEKERILFSLTREEARASADGTPISLLFDDTPPRCGFTRGQIEVLRFAADDLTDEEIADHLNMTVWAVKMRWRKIYEQVEQDEGLAALVFNGRGTVEGAGQQKRRRVVAYVRAHPEELRPYAWK